LRKKEISILRHLKYFFIICNILLTSTFIEAAPTSVRIGLSTLPPSLDPALCWNYQHFLVLKTLYQTLVRIDENGHSIADLAKTWRIEKGGRLYKFALDPKAKMHDGTPVTSKDVALSLSRHFWQGRSSALKDGMIAAFHFSGTLPVGGILPGIQTPSDHELIIELKEPYPPFLSILATAGTSVLRENGKDILSSGPLKVKTFVPSEKVVLELAHPDSHLSSIQTYFIEKFTIEDNNFKSPPDLILGIIRPDPPMKQLGSDFLLTEMNISGFLHLFFNIYNQSLFKNLEFRKDLGILFQDYTSRLPSKFEHAKLKSVIPDGIMPREYYKRPEEHLSAETFKAKWAKRFKGSEVRWVLRKDYFSEAFYSGLEPFLKQAGIPSQIKWIGPLQFMSEVKAKNYDILSGSYMRNFPDPDGLLGTLQEGSVIHYGVFPTNDLFQKISTIQYQESAEKRLSEYSQLLRPFEDQWFVIPLYRTNAQMVHRKSLSIPDTSYRYELEFWKLKWK
jgi:ABC-type transport system substrate-binding protein